MDQAAKLRQIVQEKEKQVEKLSIVKSSKIIAVTSGKGGVGKSTVTANLAVGLANNGHKVVAVDFDIGLRNLDMLLGLENRIVYDVIDVMNGKCKISQALITDKKSKNLFFLPASQTNDKNALDKAKVKILLEELKGKFDYVLLDSPAGIESGFEHAIFLADRALVISTPEVSSVRDADRVIGIMDAKSEKAENGEEIQKHLIVNRIKPDMIESGEMLSIEDVLNILAIPLIGIIPEDKDVITSTNRGEPIFYNEKSMAGEALKRIARRVNGEEVDYLEIKTEKGLLAALKRLFK
jgi:septum site-determining protein MinD